MKKKKQEPSFVLFKDILLFLIIEKWIKTMIALGDQAPDFLFTNQDGATVSLGDLSGKYALLWWYPKADTPG